MYKFLKRLYPYITPHWQKVLGSIFFSILLAGIKGLEVHLVKPVFDHGLDPKADPTKAYYLAALLLGLGALNFPCRFLHFYWIRYVVDRATCEIRSQIYDKLQRLPMSYYARAKQGKLISNIISDTSVFSGGFRNAIDLIREPLTAIVMLIMAFISDWQLTLVVFAVLPLFLIIFQASGKRVKTNQQDVQEEMSGMTHNIAEGISAQKIAKAFNLQSYIRDRFQKVQNHFFRAQMRTTKVEELAHPLVEFVGAIAFAGVIVFAHHRISSGAMSTGDFVRFVAALALLMDPIRKFSQANVKLNQSFAAGQRIFYVLGLEEEKDSGMIEKFSFEKDINIKELTFSYGEGDVITNLNINVNKGQKIALVGLSGSGKSTLINLLLGLYPYSRGDIKIDDVSLKDIKLSSLRSLFGLVSQDIFLFHDTILENLTVGREFTIEQINEALRVAHAHEFINKLPNGLDTVIGDRGTRLSGGQQQRLTIARAFLMDTPVLLFDEATSALDNESEKVVQKALDDISSDKTVIAVAHRLSTIQDYDCIYVLKEGHLFEKGTHKELIEKGGEYAKLYELSQKV